jgi:hypothetical protein
MARVSRVALFRAVLLPIAVGCSACFFQNATSTKRFNETVLEMNKATRWGQLGQAARLVDPSYRSQFAASHAAWGDQIQLGDSEVLQIELAPNEESATSTVSYEWYSTDAMTLERSVVRQRWSRGARGFLLLSEVVVKGDPRLLSLESKGSGSASPTGLTGG